MTRLLRRWLWVPCLFALLAGPSAAAEQGGKVFRAGAHAQDITPVKFPVSVNGGMHMM